MVRWLVDSGAQVSSYNLCCAYQWLVYECTSDRDSIVRLLRGGRASIGSRYDPFLDPALMTETIQRGNERVLKFLIRRGADVNVRRMLHH